MKIMLSYLLGIMALFIAFTGFAYADAAPPTVPEPGTLSLLATSGAGIGAYLLVKVRKRK